LDRRLIAVVGPTGAGKSALALDIAETFQGEIVNCDSLQLYRGFDIGSAKVPLSERRGIPHHLLDILSPPQEFSAGEYLRSARDTVAEISTRGRLPVIAGGSGFYLRALLEGLPPMPMRDLALRARLALRERRRPGSLHRLLARLEPNAARRVHSNDVQKLTRALEVRILTRESIPSSHSAEPLPEFRALKIGLDPDRASLYSRLDERVQRMFEVGLVDEVMRLLAEGATGAEKPFESLGYKQALRFVRGETTLEQALASTQLETRQYAKRQWTWFRRDPQVHWLRGFGDDASVRAQAFEIVQRFYKNSP
jgi:tRNA dimethylallyltransferase